MAYDRDIEEIALLEEEPDLKLERGSNGFARSAGKLENRLDSGETFQRERSTRELVFIVRPADAA
jgi:hypothetical protein